VEGTDGVEFGVDLLESYFIESRNEKLPVIHQRLINRLTEFSGKNGFGDDITLLTAKVKF
jgi:serine phosphatase RsbU (regulator of sigma subunit)